jgi:3-deoxy-D-manno-octulosonic-acid transferase
MLEKVFTWIHSALFPLTSFLCIFVPILKKRKKFENKNTTSIESVSFKKSNLVADFCFEVSSEGELEQIRILLEDLLANQKKVELIICSPSVESSALKLYQQYKNSLRVLRLPLVTYGKMWGQSVARWMTAPSLILCRYDFFPELTSLAMDKKSYLFAATLKNKDQMSYRHRKIYQSFNNIFTSTQSDKKKFSEILSDERSHFLELRFLSIEKRQLNLIQKFKNNKIMKDYADWLQTFPGRKLVLGSSWPLELSILDDPEFQKSILKGELHISLFPHLLDKVSIRQIQDKLKNIDSEIPVHLIQEGIACPLFEGKVGIALVLEKGFLCEFYSYFDDAYVGGGFGRSVHSLLEAFMGDCRIYCGPKIHRSTEYDLVNELSPQNIFVLKEMKDFSNYFWQKHNAFDGTKRKSMLEWTKNHYKDLSLLK